MTLKSPFLVVSFHSGYGLQLRLCHLQMGKQDRSVSCTGAAPGRPDPASKAVPLPPVLTLPTETGSALRLPSSAFPTASPARAPSPAHSLARKSSFCPVCLEWGGSQGVGRRGWGGLGMRLAWMGLLGLSPGPAAGTLPLSPERPRQLQLPQRVPLPTPSSCPEVPQVPAASCLLPWSRWPACAPAYQWPPQSGHSSWLEAPALLPQHGETQGRASWPQNSAMATRHRVLLGPLSALPQAPEASLAPPAPG